MTSPQQHTAQMGELIQLPVEHKPAPDEGLFVPDGTPDVEAGSSGSGPRNPLPPVRDGAADGPQEPNPDESADDEVIEGTVLVDGPRFRPELHERIWGHSEDRRRPIIAPWLREYHEAKATALYAVDYGWHVARFHAVRSPLYALTLTGRAPVGVYKTVRGTVRWVVDAEGMPLRLAAVARNDADTYLKLLAKRDARVKARRVLVGLGAIGVVLGIGWLAGAALMVQIPAFAALIGALGWYGTPADKSVLGLAVVKHQAPPLTSEVVIRALGSLGNAEINKSLKANGGKDWFPAPIARDGAGWRAEVDLPYGVTATDIMEKRSELASGLRRPVGCVWPEAAEGEHSGRLILWVGDQPMSKAKKPAWPLAKTGQVDLFAPVPWGTDQRGRWVDVTLMFTAGIIGSIPRMGKTFLLRLLMLIFALDPRAEIHAYDLKGTGDLSPGEPVAYAYRAGDEDEDIEYALNDLRALRKELRRRAKVIRNLPKDICPENKVTPALAADRSMGLHPIGIFTDECQVWFEHPKHGGEFEELCTDLAKRGPALGIHQYLATQRPDSKSIPTGISANVPLRWCLKVMGHTENDMVLGTSMHKNGIRATMFSRKDKGICYFAGEEDAPMIVAGTYIDAPAAEAIALRGRALRVAAGTLTGYAAGQDAEPESVEQRAALLVDILAITKDSEDRIRSHELVDRLAAYKPDTYAPWARVEGSDAEMKTAKATTLAAALKPYGVTTVQVNRSVGNGKRENSQGIVRDRVEDALAEARRTG